MYFCLVLFQGFSGDRCQYVNSECIDDPCLNGGTCEPTKDGHHCVCPEGVTGSSCEYDLLDECSSSPCQNRGRCRNRIG